MNRLISQRIVRLRNEIKRYRDSKHIDTTSTRRTVHIERAWNGGYFSGDSIRIILEKLVRPNSVVAFGSVIMRDVFQTRKYLRS